MCVYIYIYIYVYIYMCIYTYMYIHMYMYIPVRGAWSRHVGERQRGPGLPCEGVEGDERGRRPKEQKKLGGVKTRRLECDRPGVEPTSSGPQD